MQKNDKFYTFLLSHSSKINSRQVQVSKRLVHGSVIAIFLLIGFTALGIGLNGVLKDAGVSQLNNQPGFVSKVSAQVPVSTNAINYSRPGGSIGSGGPAIADSANGESTELEKQLGILRTTSNPSKIPSEWAHLGKINNEFGFRRNPFGGRTYEFHAGMDIDGERGDLVKATADGIVVKSGYEGGYGNMVEIDHGNGLTTRYGHLAKVNVEVGVSIGRGDVLGFVGSTGRSTGPHLHYEVRLNAKPVNPRHFLPTEPTVLAHVVG